MSGRRLLESSENTFLFLCAGLSTCPFIWIRNICGGLGGFFFAPLLFWNVNVVTTFHVSQDAFCQAQESKFPLQLIFYWLFSGFVDSWVCIIFFFLFFYLFLFLFFYLSWILSYIEMKQPWVYMRSPSRPPSQLPLHPLPPGFPIAQGPSACLLHPTWAS